MEREIENLTLRDYFAARALTSVLTYPDDSAGWEKRAAVLAYKVADEMILERDKMETETK